MLKHRRILAILSLCLFLLATPGRAEGEKTATSYLSQLWHSLVSIFERARGDFDPWGGDGTAPPDGEEGPNGRGGFDPWGVDPEG